MGWGVILSHQNVKLILFFFFFFFFKGGFTDIFSFTPFQVSEDGPADVGTVSEILPFELIYD
jgi:hypothetical protein